MGVLSIGSTMHGYASQTMVDADRRSLSPVYGANRNYGHVCVMSCSIELTRTYKASLLRVSNALWQRRVGSRDRIPGWGASRIAVVRGDHATHRVLPRTPHTYIHG